MWNVRAMSLGLMALLFGCAKPEPARAPVQTAPRAPSGKLSKLHVMRGGLVYVERELPGPDGAGIPDAHLANALRTMVAVLATGELAPLGAADGKELDGAAALAAPNPAPEAVAQTYLTLRTRYAERTKDAPKGTVAIGYLTQVHAVRAIDRVTFNEGAWTRNLYLAIDNTSQEDWREIDLSYLDDLEPSACAISRLGPICTVERYAALMPRQLPASAPRKNALTLASGARTTWRQSGPEAISPPLWIDDSKRPGAHGWLLCTGNGSVDVGGDGISKSQGVNQCRGGTHTLSCSIVYRDGPPPLDGTVRSTQESRIADAWIAAHGGVDFVRAEAAVEDLILDRPAPVLWTREELVVGRELHLQGESIKQEQDVAFSIFAQPSDQVAVKASPSTAVKQPCTGVVVVSAKAHTALDVRAANHRMVTQPHTLGVEVIDRAIAAADVLEEKRSDLRMIRPIAVKLEKLGLHRLREQLQHARRVESSARAAEAQRLAGTAIAYMPQGDKPHASAASERADYAARAKRLEMTIRSKLATETALLKLLHSNLGTLGDTPR